MVNRLKASEIVNLLKSLNAKEITKIERSDPQFKALEKLWNCTKNRKSFYKLVITNALLSYQLQMKGEDYWTKFSEFMCQGKTVEEFLKVYNKRLLNHKLKRLEKIKSCLNEELLDTVYDLEKLVVKLSSCLKQKKESKTITFCAKMVRYALLIAEGREPLNVWKIAMPIDSRIAKISKSQNFWRKVAELSEIPPLLIDGILWNHLGNKR